MYRDPKGLSVERLCGLVGFSRQAYYKGCRVRQRRTVDEDAIVEQVKAQRRLHPRIGARKLCVLVRPLLAEMGVAVGRDRLFALLKARGLLVSRSRRWVKTTQSRHRFGVWPNLVRHVEPTMVNQVWVSDLTYIRTEEGFLYLSLVTDSFSRKIVGFCVNDTLEAQGCREALKMALRALPDGVCPIHHSDRGIQYCSSEYVALLTKRGCPISMTEMNHCYENARAERVNGILKDEYALGRRFRTKGQARAAVRQAIDLYNRFRPHMCLEWKTPEEVYSRAA